MVVENFYVFDDVPLIFLIASEHAVSKEIFLHPRSSTAQNCI